MQDTKIEVISYEGYRGEERPRAFIFFGMKIDVLSVLGMWREEDRNTGQRKRFFKVKGSDGKTYILYYDDAESEWFYRKGEAAL